jgi:hypothetical protein
MAPTNSRVRRLVIAGAFAVAAVALPAYAMVASTAGSTDRSVAECLAWFGSRNDGQCIGWSNSGTQGVSGGIPSVGWGAPGSGNPGFSTGPLLPGQTWNVPLGP